MRRFRGLVLRLIYDEAKPLDINARLWQDPFDAVARDVEGGGDRTPLAGNLDLLGTGGDRAIDLFCKVGLYYQMTVTTDDTLAHTLACELMRRDPSLHATNQYKRRFQLTLSADLRDWMDLHCLAERTRCITNLVYFPFLVWAVMLFSRSRLFDDFSMSWQLAVAYVASLCLLIGSVVAYRLTAEKARRVACRQLTDRIIRAKREGREATVGQLETLLTDMQELREGAFAPWASQPLVTAVLLPLLTYGGTTLVHLYALPGI